jgi:hypothetical protein
MNLEETRITIFLKYFGVNKINKRVATSNKLKNNYAYLVTSGLGPNVARLTQFAQPLIKIITNKEKVLLI